MSRQKRAAAFLFIVPFLVFFVAFYVAPLIVALNLSLYINTGLSSTFVGLRNFMNVFTDPQFYNGLLTVVLFGVIQVPVMVFVAMAIALLLNSPFVWGSKIYRLLVFLPYAVPGVVSALIWSYLYTPGISPISQIIESMGIKQFSFLSPNVILFSIMNIVTWEWCGYNSVIFHSALQAQPIELDEAAQIEGASWLRIAWHIKVPLLKSTIIMVLMFSIVGTLQLFNEPFIISSLSTLPYSFTPNMYIYNTAFQFGNFNYAAALSFVLALVTFLASFLLMRAALPRRRR